MLLDIQSVQETLEFTLAGEYDEYLYNVSAAPYIVDTAGLLAGVKQVAPGYQASFAIGLRLS